MNVVTSKGSLKIASVDDCQVSQLAIQYHLEKANLSATHFYDGNEAIKTLDSNKFDLILLDLEIRKFDGLNILKFIKDNKNSKNYKSKIFIITSHTSKEKIQKCLSNGADEYLIKPLYVRDFLRLINKHFN